MEHSISTVLHSDHKRCTKCLSVLHKAQFYAQRNGLLGVKAECKACSTLRSCEAAKSNRERINACRREYYWKHRDEKRAKRILQPSQTGELRRIREREYWNRNPEKLKAKRNRAKGWLRKWYLLRLYNLSVEEYEAIKKEQRDCCAICHQNAKLYVDHCHKQKVVRGLLCDKCNRGLGYFKDNVTALAEAIVYLRKSTVKNAK